MARRFYVGGELVFFANKLSALPFGYHSGTSILQGRGTSCRSCCPYPFFLLDTGYTDVHTTSELGEKVK